MKSDKKIGVSGVKPRRQVHLRSWRTFRPQFVTIHILVTLHYSLYIYMRSPILRLSLWYTRSVHGSSIGNRSGPSRSDKTSRQLDHIKIYFHVQYRYTRSQNRRSSKNATSAIFTSPQYWHGYMPPRPLPKILSHRPTLCLDGYGNFIPYSLVQTLRQALLAS